MKPRVQYQVFRIEQDGRLRIADRFPSKPTEKEAADQIVIPDDLMSDISYTVLPVYTNKRK